MRKVLPLLLVLSFLSSLLSAQTTYDFTSAPTLTNPSYWPTSWKTNATVSIGGVSYLLEAGGNGTWTHMSTGGNGNSYCLRKDGSGGDQLRITRVDGQPFQFYGIWLKHHSMYSPPFYQPPYYTITYNKAAGGTEVFTYSNSATQSTETYVKDIAVSSVSISLSSIMYFWIDDLKVGPASLATPLSATTSYTNVSCNGGSNGVASVVASGGTAPYTYSWSPSGGTGATASGLAAGTYTCTITDAAAASITKNVTVSQPAVLSVTAASLTNIACFGGATGSATINTPTGGTAPYTYNWTPGNPTGDGSKTVTGLSAGTYTATATDANGCTASVNFTISQPTALAMSAASQTNIACFGGATGAASINAPTGGMAPYTYNWTPGNPTGDGTRSVTGLAAGVYTVTVTDAYGCTKTQNFTITQQASLAVTPSQQNVTCNGGSNGSASVSVSGGMAPYAYSWSPSGGTAATASGLSAGVYTCTVSDSYGCTTQYSFTITQPPSITVSSVSSASVCSGSSTNIALSSNTGGAGFAWTVNNISGTVTGASAGSGNSIEQALSGDGVIEYVITPSLDGCTGVSKTVQVTVKAAPSVSEHPANKTVNPGNSATFNVSASNATSYQWQVNQGEGFMNISDGETYSGYTSSELSIHYAGSWMNGYQYRCIASGECAPAAVSNTATLSTISTDANLSGITVSPGTLNPSFAQATTGYSAQVLPSTASINITPSAAHGAATIKVNGNPVTSGSATSVSLSGGVNTITIVVTAEDGTTTKSYTVQVTRPYLSVESIVPADAPVTNASEKSFNVVLSGELNGLTASNLSLSGTGTLAGYSITGVSQTGSSTYKITVNTGSGNGTLKLNLVNDTELSAPIQGLPYNSESGYILDRTIPEVNVKNLTMKLGSTASVSLTASQLDNGSTDNYSTEGHLAFSADKTVFGSNDLGNNEVTLTVTDEAGNSASKTATVTIEKDVISVEPATAVNITYGEELSLPEQTLITYSDLTSEYLAINWDTEGYTGNAGEYYLTGTFQASDFTNNEESLKAKVVVNVSKRVLNVWLDGEVSKTYDGGTDISVTQQVFSSDRINNDHLVFSGTASYDNKKVGTGKKITVSDLGLSGEDAGNYTLESAAATGNIGIITKRTLNVSLTGSVEKTYDGTTDVAAFNQQIFTSDMVDGDELTYSGEAEYDNKHAGSHKQVTINSLTLAGPDAGNYEPASATVSAAIGVIVPKAIEASLMAEPQITKVYDGNANATLAAGNYKLHGTIEGDDIAVSGTATYDNSNAGTEKSISVTHLGLSGSDKLNYTLENSSAVTVGAITRKTLEAYLLPSPAIAKVYDGNDIAEITPASYAIDGIVGEDHVLLNNPSTGTYEDKNAGTHKVVTVSGIHIQGESAGNYELASETITSNIGKITPKPVSVVAANKSKVYGNDDPAFTYEVSGLVGEEQLEGALGRESGSNVGTYEIGIGTLNGGTNYSIDEFSKAALQITPAELLIEAENKSRLQGAPNPQFTFRFTGLKNGDTPSDLDTAPQAITNAEVKSPIGIYEILAAGAVSHNYNISFGNGKLTILPKAGDDNNNMKAWSSAPGTIQVRIYVEKEQKAALILYTEAGQPVFLERKTLASGMNVFSMHVGYLSSSTYVLRLASQQLNIGQRVQVK